MVDNYQKLTSQAVFVLTGLNFYWGNTDMFRLFKVFFRVVKTSSILKRGAVSQNDIYYIRMLYDIRFFPYCIIKEVHDIYYICM